MASTPTTQAPQTKKELDLDKWRAQMMSLWANIYDQKGPEAFAACIDLAATLTNSACCATRRKVDDPDETAGYRWEDIEGIDPLLAAIAQNANQLLRLLDATLHGRAVR